MSGEQVKMEALIMPDGSFVDVRYCEDCKFYQAGKGSDAYAAASDKCLYPRQMKGIRLVRRGAVSPRDCASERTWSDPDSCGPTANWFEPKPPIVEQVG